jgi:type III secretion protein N (ATPase)
MTKDGVPAFPDLLAPLTRRSEPLRTRKIHGKVTEAVGLVVKAVLPGARIGEICELRRPGNQPRMQAEVVGFSQDATLLMPLGDAEGLSPATEVVPLGRSQEVGVGPELLGRVLDGMGNFMDSGPATFTPEAHYPVYGNAPNPLLRRPIERPVSMGVRVLDGMLTVGEGQRMGIFAAAGVGKSTLLAQILRNTEAEIVVLALVGERGREVREFLEQVLTEETRHRTCIIVSTSDRPAIEWIKSASIATCVAEYFRDQGRKVLLLIDSLTRFARAQRLIGLATGEPPARRGFPPSVFSALPRLLERAGNSDKGSITALYTVLVEGDDMNEPVADEVRSILDGHLILSRKLAAANHYPAIDVLESVSRVMNQITSREHRKDSGHIRELLSRYQDAEMLIKIGEYKAGSDALTDEAIAKIEQIRVFLRQDVEEKSSFDETLAQLKRLSGL